MQVASAAGRSVSNPSPVPRSPPLLLRWLPPFPRTLLQLLLPPPPVLLRRLLVLLYSQFGDLKLIIIN